VKKRTRGIVVGSDNGPELMQSQMRGAVHSKPGKGLEGVSATTVFFLYENSYTCTSVALRVFI